ncbi:MAG: hypothetical protein OER82_05385 [Nitrosopumilus sp.]|nr:hypothetical protein [Nitrosopumilus sp.]
MVYSNALYFASHSDRSTVESLSSFRAKQKSQKAITKEQYQSK